jgi:hypothetical protein
MSTLPATRRGHECTITWEDAEEPEARVAAICHEGDCTWRGPWHRVSDSDQRYSAEDRARSDADRHRAGQTVQQPSPLPGTGHFTAPDGRPFPWGPIDRVHRVGRFAIVEFRRDESKLWSPDGKYLDRHNATQFHPYIDGRDASTSYSSLESALVGAVGYLREGPNGRAASYFDRMTLPAEEAGRG